MVTPTPGPNTVKFGIFLDPPGSAIPWKIIERGRRGLNDALLERGSVLERLRGAGVLNPPGFGAKVSRRHWNRMGNYWKEITRDHLWGYQVPSGLPAGTALGKATINHPQSFPKFEYGVNTGLARDPVVADRIIEKWRRKYPLLAKYAIWSVKGSWSDANVVVAAPWWFLLGDLGALTQMQAGNVEILVDSVPNVFVPTSGKAPVAKLAPLTMRALFILTIMGISGAEESDLNAVQTEFEAALTAALNPDLASGYTGTVFFVTGTLGIGVQVDYTAP